MKTIYKILLLLGLSTISITNVFPQADTLYVVNAVAVDTNNVGYFQAVEIEFSQPINDATVNESKWHFSNNADPQGNDVAGNKLETKVEYITNSDIANDRFIRIGFDGTDTKTPNNTYDKVYLRFANEPNLTAFYTTKYLWDTTSTSTKEWYALDYAGPKINSVSFLPGNGNTLAIGDTLEVTITANASEENIVADTLIINGTYVPKDSLKESTTAGEYTFKYIVSPNDNDINDGTDSIPINFVLKDPGGNLSVAYTSNTESDSPGIDANRPTITSVTFTPKSGGVLGVGDDIEVNITASESDLTPRPLTINTQNIDSLAVSNNGGGSYSFTYTIIEGNGNILDNEVIPINFVFVDPTGNPSTPFTEASLLATNCPSIDANSPSITGVTFTPSVDTVMQVGEDILVEITGSEADLIASSLTINTQVIDPLNVSDDGGGSYSFTYTIAEGNGDILDSEVIPINFVFEDTAGNSSSAYTEASLLATNCPSIDANSPSITGVTFTPSVDTVLQVGEDVLVEITASEADLIARPLTINGNTIDSLSVSDDGGGSYSFTYTVAEGNGNILDDAVIPFDFVFVDTAGNTSASYTESSVGAPAANACPAIDANSPTITSVTFTPKSGGVLGVGDDIEVNITASESDLTPRPLTINTQNIDSLAVSNNGGGSYSFTYTIIEGNGNILDNEVIPINFVFVDPTGNPSTPFTEASLLATNCPSIDANSPSITGVTFTPSVDTVMQVGEDILVEITGSEADLIASSLTINGKNIDTSTVSDVGTIYSFTYTIAEGNGDILDSEVIPINFVFEDTAGNSSSAYTEASLLATNCPSIDANSPSITGVTFTPSVDTVLQVGEDVLVEITASEADLIARPLTINGNTIDSLSVSDDGGGSYSFTYTVAEGNGNILDDAVIPFDFVFVDTAGNTSASYTESSVGAPAANACPAIDANSPTITSVTFTPKSGGVLGVGDDIEVNITASESDLTPRPLTINTQNIDSLAVSNNGGGSYSFTYTIIEGNGNILDNEVIPINFVFVDPTGNPSTPFTEASLLATNCPSIDANSPSITGVTFTPDADTVMQVGEDILVEITGSEADLIASSLTINGKNIDTSTVSDVGTIYSFTYTIAEGNGDILDSEVIPINFVFEDTAGNSSSAYTEASLLATNCPSIDANSPSITGVTFTPSVDTVLQVGEDVLVEITASEADLIARPLTINGNTIDSLSVSDDGGGSYSFTYTVAEGNGNILDDAVIPFDFVFVDTAGNTSASYTESSVGAPAANACPAIDANSPTITSVTFTPKSGGVLGVGDDIEVNITASESDLTPRPLTINGKNIDSLAVSNNGGGSYSFTYTIIEGNGNILDNEVIPINFVFVDPTGNPSTPFTEASLLATNCPSIDANSPSITGVTFTPDADTVMQVGEDILVEITGSEADLIASSLTINGKNIDTSTVSDVGTIYSFTYTIAEGNGDILDSEVIPINFVFEDTAGNSSSAYTEASLLATNCPSIDAHSPSISGFDIPDTKMLLGDTVQAIITINAATGDDSYTLTKGKIAGYPIDSIVWNVDKYFAYFKIASRAFNIDSLQDYYVDSLVLTDMAGNSSSPYNIKISQDNDPIYTILPTAKVTGTYNVCDKDSANLSFNLTGSAPWDIILFDGSTTKTITGINESPFTYKVEANDNNGSIDPDTLIYKITQVTDVNENIKNMSGLDSAVVFTYGIPTVNFIYPVGDKTYNIQAKADTLIGNHSGGVFSGNGIIPSNNTFLASAAGVGDHNIIYTYTETSPANCFSSQTLVFTVDSSDASITFDNGDDDWRCDYEPNMNVTAEVIGKSITGQLFLPADPTAITDHNDNTATINIQDLTAGTYQVRFDYVDGTPVSFTRSFTVESVDNTVNFTNLTDQCEDYDTVFVNAVNLIPADGTGKYIFSGDNTAFEYDPTDSKLNSGYLLPGKITPGSYNLKYVYRTAKGCESDTVAKSFNIDPLPNVSFTMNSVYNIDEGTSTITGDPLGATGVFSPQTFMSNNGDGTAEFDPVKADIGEHWVKYTFTDGNGCVNSDSVKTEVSKADGNVASSSGSFHFCYWTTRIDTLIGTPDPTNGTPGTFKIDDVTVTPYDDNKILINPKDYIAGDHTVKYIYSDGVASYTITKTMTIDSVGTVFVTDISDKCEDYDTIFVNAFNLNPAGGTGEFIFSGNSDAFAYDSNDPKNNTGYFLPDRINPGSYNLKYVYTNLSGCPSDTVKKSFNVNPLPGVSLTMNNTYNVDQNPVLISGTPLGSTGEFTPVTFMSNNGDGTANFDPGDAGLGLHWVKYTYEDSKGCISSDSVMIEVDKALGSIISSKGSFNLCYYNGAIDTLTGVPFPTDGSPGNFYIDSVLISPESDNKILINPQDYQPGNHDVVFKYSNGPIPYEVHETLNIDSIGTIYFTGLDDEYCEDDDREIKLTAIYPGLDGTMKFTGNGITDNTIDELAYFNPSNSILGGNEITYTFTRDYSGCQKAYNKNVTLNKLPYVDFHSNEQCIVNAGDLVQFIADTLASDSITTWNWTFRSALTSDNQSPLFAPAIGTNQMKLKLTTNKGCNDELTKSVYIGTRVDLEFTFENVCNGENVVFTLVESSDTVDVINSEWNFGGEGEASYSGDTAYYKYKYPGAYEVVYQEDLYSCGKIADTVKVNIRPSVDLDNINYFQDFEDNPDVTGWVIEDLVNGANNSWQWGMPAGSIINTASSGSYAYVTNLNGDYGIDEKGMVTSPCFNFGSKERPMMKMDYNSATQDGIDGAVIQYTDENGTWKTLGLIPNEGVNWYNSAAISGSPANQTFGWTGNSLGWKTAMYSLDDLRGRQGVRFRIVFGSNGDVNDEGFAFDKIWFGERTRMVLLENFTDITSEEANTRQKDIINPILLKDSMDVIDLNYHTNFNSANDFNAFYPSGPSARSLFYGVSEVPYSIIDGNDKFDYTLAYLEKADVDRRVLIDPLFDIRLSQDIQNDNLIISSTVKAVEDITGQNVLVYVAIVEKTVVAGSNTYNNVLRKMLPDAAGILVEQNWLNGDSVNVYQTWPIPDEVNSDSLITIVFVQDEDNKEIYQTAYTDKYSTVTSIDDLVDNNANFSYMVYPNPVSDNVMIQLINAFYYDTDIMLYNAVGSLIKSVKLTKGSYQANINMGDFPSGIYYIKLRSEKAGDSFRVTKLIKSK